MNKNRKSRAARGFSIVETLAVVSLATILGSVGLSATVNLLKFQRIRNTQNRMTDIQGALGRYYADEGAYPAGNDLAGLTQLALSPTNDLKWQGPYLKKGRVLAELKDAWGKDLSYRTGVNANNVDLAVVISPGPDGVVNSNLTTWTLGTWSPAGDDYAQKLTSKDINQFIMDNTRQLLARLRNRLVSQNPMRAPASFATPSDGWGNPIRYLRCSRYSAVLYSFGRNKTDNSTGLADPCTTGVPGPDDIMEFVPWSPFGRLSGLLNDGWTGGMHADQAVCQSYTYIAVNNFTDPLVITYYDSSLTQITVIVAANSTGVVSDVYPWAIDSTGFGGTVPLTVKRNGITYDSVVPANADLDQDCVYKKIYLNKSS